VSLPAASVIYLKVDFNPPGNSPPPRAVATGRRRLSLLVVEGGHSSLSRDCC